MTIAAGTVWEIPHPDTLTFAELDDIFEATGVDIRAAPRPAMVMAAIVCWMLRRQGQIVDLDDVYKTMTLGSVRFSTVDPTQPGPTPG